MRGLSKQAYLAANIASGLALAALLFVGIKETVKQVKKEEAERKQEIAAFTKEAASGNPLKEPRAFSVNGNKKRLAIAAFADEAASNDTLKKEQGPQSLDIGRVQNAFLGVAGYLEKPVEVEIGGTKYLVGMCTDVAPYCNKFTIEHGDIVWVGKETDKGTVQVRAGIRGFGASMVVLGGTELELSPENFLESDIAALKRLYVKAAWLAADQLFRAGAKVAGLKGEENAILNEKKRLERAIDSLTEARNMVGKRHVGTITENRGGKNTVTYLYDSLVSPKYDSARAALLLEIEGLKPMIEELDGKNNKIRARLRQVQDSIAGKKPSAAADWKRFPANKARSWNYAYARSAALHRRIMRA